MIDDTARGYVIEYCNAELQMHALVCTDLKCADRIPAYYKYEIPIFHSFIYWYFNIRDSESGRWSKILSNSYHNSFQVSRISFHDVSVKPFNIYISRNFQALF